VNDYATFLASLATPTLAGQVSSARAELLGDAAAELDATAGEGLTRRAQIVKLLEGAKRALLEVEVEPESQIIRDALVYARISAALAFLAELAE
jgi:hypothetical protein